jgi:predicted nucleotidyltransferase
MRVAISDGRAELVEASKRLHASRFDVFGSAANESFDPGRGDVDSLVDVAESIGSDFSQDPRAPIEAVFARTRSSARSRS